MTAFNNQVRHWKKEMPALIFLLKLLLLLSSVKLLFFVFNRSLIHVNTPNAGWLMAGWSLYYDLLILLAINIPFLLLVILSLRNGWGLLTRMLIVVFTLCNFFCVILNIADIPYFHFHSQRANADLLYVIQDPLQKTFVRNPMVTIAALALCIAVIYILYRFHDAYVRKSSIQNAGGFFVVAGAVLFLVAVPAKKYIPTYPLTHISSSELQAVQNSFHTFLYSVYRHKDGMVRPYNFMDKKKADEIAQVNHIVRPGSGKNIVLFIMESIPADYFESGNRYKVRMPFFDSLLQHSTYYSNAYSYSRNSNKGIVAILAGLPTLTEIPLYHSGYADLKRTRPGMLLGARGYSSLFTIGDNYDDFGFAKCTNWLGIQKYYCKDDLNGELQYHTMGVHDEYVLDFLGKKLSTVKQPFFSVQYNISTHYPNDLPAGYKEEYRKENFTPGMKSMQYYSECMRVFFKNAKLQPWYNNSVFIFCSDHWVFPDESAPAADMWRRFRIPVFIFDPAVNRKEIISNPVSQLDIMNTVLKYGGINDTIISYGRSLHDSLPGRIVFMRENSTLYQAVDSSFVLGFNPVNNKVEYLYNFKEDPVLISDLPVADTNRLLIDLKAYLQKASNHYNNIN